MTTRAKLESELDKLQNEIEDLEYDLQQAENALEDLNDEICGYNAQISMLREAESDLYEQLDALSDESSEEF